MSNIDIEIIGEGNIGAKARQLLDKTLKLRDMGFYTPRRVVLAEDFFDGFFQKNSLGKNLRDIKFSDDLESKIKRGCLTKEEFQTLQKIVSSYGDVPLLERSSAEGDSRGIGIYKSECTSNNIIKVINGIKEVLASYFSEDAILFRKDAKTGEGSAVIIENMIGQRLGEFFCPVLSGFGYTSTSWGEGYINIVPGLFGGVESLDGERITRTSFLECGRSMGEYLLEKPKNQRGISSIRERENGSPWGIAFDGSNTKKDYLEFPGEVGRHFYLLDLTTLFDKMKSMEETFKKPQYFEFALTIEQGKPKYWILQIADVDKKIDVFDFYDGKEVLFQADNVMGSGVRECTDIVWCFNFDEIPILRKLNNKKKDYVLLFSSRLVLKKGRDLPEKMSYRHFSNASVLVEDPECGHAGDLVDHLGGTSALTGKLVGVLNENLVPNNMEKFYERQIKKDDIGIYPGKVKVVASERQQRMQFIALD